MIACTDRQPAQPNDGLAGEGRKSNGPKSVRGGAA
jgi:hypothetical protein